MIPPTEEDDGLEPPWGPQNPGPGERTCVRCGDMIPEYWRHHWPPCWKCNLWSLAGRNLLAYFGLNGQPWLYGGARSWCDNCEGTGYLPCKPQDLSILRVSGACTTCGASAFKLVHATAEDRSDVEGSARHYDDDADHEVIVGSAPLVRTLRDLLEQNR